LRVTAQDVAEAHGAGFAAQAKRLSVAEPSCRACEVLRDVDRLARRKRGFVPHQQRIKVHGAMGDAALEKADLIFAATVSHDRVHAFDYDADIAPTAVEVGIRAIAQLARQPATARLQLSAAGTLP
jgi:hypothetical protein